jgi:hypothetical protein
VQKLSFKGKISNKKTDKIFSYIFVALIIVLGVLYFVLFLGIGGYWISPWLWIGGVIVTGIILVESYLLNKLVSKRLFAFILLCIIITIPSFVVTAAVSNQSTAQSLSTTTEENYFKTLLGKSYNYTELIEWENQHLVFYDKSDLQRNTDPIKIVEYGKGKCGEFATLYAELCISQGYRCRIIQLVFNDHAFNEVLLSNGTWIRVDASLNSTGPRAVGYPMFFEKEPGWTAPIFALAFENSTITEVTNTYRSDGFKMFSLTTITVFVSLLGFLVYAILKELILSQTSNPVKDSNNEEKEKISQDEEKERDKLIYEIILNRHDQELQRTGNLDSKANNTIGFAGIIATLIVTIVSYFPNGTYTLLFPVPLALLVVSAMLGLLAYRVKMYEAIQPREFIEEYKDKTLRKTLREYTGTVADSTLKNHIVHENKAKLIEYASGLLVLAITLFFVIAISNWLV